MRGEFSLIADFFAPLAREPGAFGLRNDAAVLDLPAGDSLVATLDTLVEGVHYRPEDPPDQVAQKLLRVNLSDLAAMGARPLGYLLSTALAAGSDERWLAGFVEGLAADQARFALGLLGGDTVKTPGPVTLSLTAFGAVARGRALTRGGAGPGDLVYLSGTLGDAALGLLALEGKLGGLSDAEAGFLADRYRLPQPRLALGAALPGLASACLDVSDGLVADLGHLLEESGCGAEVRVADLPLSAAARAALAAEPGLIERVLAGGDDYELLFTVPPAAAPRVAALAEALDLPLSRIGRLGEPGVLRLLDSAGRPLEIARGGWSHF